MTDYTKSDQKRELGAFYNKLAGMIQEQRLTLQEMDLPSELFDEAEDLLLRVNGMILSEAKRILLSARDDLEQEAETMRKGVA